MWLWVDFNAVKGDMIWTSVRRTEGVSEDELVEDQRIGLRDHEGNSCWATITEMRGPIVYLRLDWSTWTPAEDEQESKLNFTTGNPPTHSFGRGMDRTDRVGNSRVALTTTKRTGELQPL